MTQLSAASGQITPEPPAGDGLMGPPQSVPTLSALPVEVQVMVLDAADDAYSRYNLGTTSRHWRRLWCAQAGRSSTPAWDAVVRGDRFTLAWALETPNDATSFVTGCTDADGMTPLMHAARLHHRALLRCMLRHTGDHLDQRDNARFTARDWASLTGHQGDFWRDQEAIRPDGIVGHSMYGSYTLRTATRVGHQTLRATLLGAHYIAENPFQAPFRVDGLVDDDGICEEPVRAVYAKTKG